MNVAEVEQALAGIEVVTSGPELEAVTTDWWPLALLRQTRGDELPRPLAVVRPRSTDQVAAVLRWAGATEVAVVPRGGGSGVCGGAIPPAGSIVLDMTAMNRVIAIDEQSHLIHVEAGALGDEVESALNARGLMLGHYTQSFSLSSVGGWIAATSAGQASPGFGFIENKLVGVTVVLADGSIVCLKPVPRSAAGPNLRMLFLGSEGVLGVVTEAWLTAAPLTEHVVWSAYRLPDFTSCFAAAREIYHGGIHPRINRGWDEDDSRHGFGSIGVTDGCVAIVGFTEGEPGLADRLAATEDIYRSHGGEPLGSEPGKLWFEHRFGAADVFRDVMGPKRSLGTGVIIDTVEVAGTWSVLEDLYRAVRGALLTHAESARCHFSHVFASGACLYTTFIVRGADDTDVELRYHDAWNAVARSCIDAGGTIAHHHGMGRLKARFTDDELGSSAAQLLRRIKAELDPAGILNPGALLP